MIRLTPSISNIVLKIIFDGSTEDTSKFENRLSMWHDTRKKQWMETEDGRTSTRIVGYLNVGDLDSLLGG